MGEGMGSLGTLVHAGCCAWPLLLCAVLGRAVEAAAPACMHNHGACTNILMHRHVPSMFSVRQRATVSVRHQSARCMAQGALSLNMNS